MKTKILQMFVLGIVVLMAGCGDSQKNITEKPDIR